MLAGAADRAVAIGMSAGGVESLRVIARRLPDDLDAGVIIAQHVGAFSTLPALLSEWSGRQVEFAHGGECIARGKLYVCPPGHHIWIEPDFTIRISTFEPILMVRPSVDWLFGSVAATFAERAVGVVLSGANGDGARGLREILRAGGRAIVQAPSSCAFRMMGDAALEQCPGALSGTPDEVASAIIASVNARPIAVWDMQAQSL